MIKEARKNPATISEKSQELRVFLILRTQKLDREAFIQWAIGKIEGLNLRNTDPLEQARFRAENFRPGRRATGVADAMQLAYTVRGREAYIYPDDAPDWWLPGVSASGVACREQLDFLG